MYVLLLRALRRPGRSPQTPTQRQTGYLAWYSSRVGASPCSSQCIGQLVHICTEAAFSDAPTLMRCRFFGDGAMHMHASLNSWKKHNGSGRSGDDPREYHQKSLFLSKPRAGTAFHRQQRATEELSRNKINSSLAMAMALHLRAAG